MSRGWILVTLIVVAVLGGLALYQLGPASAGSLRFGVNMRSNMAADYSGRDADQVGFLRLTIFQEFFRDLGLNPLEAEEQARQIEATLDGVVPTATALNFDGDAPLTATPTATPIPTDTPTPLPTATTRPSSTPSRTPTTKPTDSPPTPTKTPGALPTATKTPGATATSGADNLNPEIKSGWTLVPPPGTLTQCSFQVIDLRVKDPAPSSGLLWARLKYEDPDSPGSYIESGDLTLTSGGWSGGAWDAKYTGSISLSDVDTGDPIIVWGKARDNAGNTGYLELATYTMGVDCP